MGGSVLSYDDDDSGGWLAAATGDRVVLLPADVPAALRIWAGLTAGMVFVMAAGMLAAARWASACRKTR